MSKHLNAIIVFNTDRFLEKQFELFNKNVGGDFIVIDNSNDYFMTRNIRNITKRLKIEYIKTSVNEADFSRSHAYACKVAYELAHDYDSLLIADHDMFPVEKFDLAKYEGYLLAGVQQMRTSNSMFGKENQVIFEYMQPALLYINVKELKGFDVDFNPMIVMETFLDTGGGLYKIILGNKERCHFFSEEHVHEDDNIMWSRIEGVWMHFINGGNWKKDENHDKRIKTLMGKLP